MKSIWMGHTKQVSEFIYLECNLSESRHIAVEYCMKVANGRKVAGAIKTLVNVRGLQLQCARVLYETLLMAVMLLSCMRNCSYLFLCMVVNQ